MAVGDKIYIADKTTLDEVKSNVGSNADVSNSSGSVHAKLKELRTLVDSVESDLAIIKGYTDSVEGTLSTINSNVNTIKTNTANTSIIKSVQRGLADFYEQDGTRTIAISTIDPNKVHVSINGTGYYDSSTTSNPDYTQDAVITSVTSNSITIRLGKNSGSLMSGLVSWEVVEYV
ncbi:hypothetical protein [Schinkia azotoformans]|uniref:hypothetical protein n=1 Tax=Schinkia azotoformans TaxID=1454 RepID=UPI002DC02603|nr:hypothetical protein [Schinkia azotoformans]MEC1757361.1 hypothetical protein [Schinkia azotoformans]